MRRARNRKYLYLCHMSKKQKYYVVWAGVMPGIYDSWTDCQLQTKGYDGAQFKSFDTLKDKIFEQVEIDAPVVFTTAYDEYALQAFQVSSIDYLLKPVTLASLERALNKLRLFDTEERLAHIRQTNRTIQSRHTVRSLLIMLADKFYPLPVEEILYFYTANEKVTAYTFDGKQHPVDRTLDALGEQLDERLFFRANRQFIISRNAIKDIDLWFGSRLSVNLTLPVPERIIISKTKTPIFKKWILREEE